MEDKNRKALIDAFATDDGEGEALVDDIMVLVQELEKVSQEFSDQFINEIISTDWTPEKSKD